MLTAAGAFVATLVGIILSMALLRRANVVDVPTDRSSHTRPTLRGGGLGPAVVALGFVAFVPGLEANIRVSMLIAGGLFALLGLADDLRDVSPLARFLGQLAAAGVAVPWLLVGLDGPLLLVAVGAVLAVLWVVSYVNAFNFMDGINGISAAQAIAAGGAFGIAGTWTGSPAVGALGAIVAGVALAFLPFNFPRARLFLGDVGSYFFGAVLALLVLVALRAGFTLEAALAPVAVYLADTGTTLARRFWQGEPWHQPHRDHVYQRLVKLGRSHTQVSTLVFSAVLVCSLAGMLTLVMPAARPFALAVIALVLALYLFSPRLGARRAAASPTPGA
jgi:UDP-N-acetylmuramyl pentapeptide phosphotransferase/UDP-N-acetylglucosamine-1-phosphate transferase